MNLTEQKLKIQLREWRSNLGISRERAALKLRVSMATYIRWETGKSNPRGLSQLASVKRELGQ